MVKSKHFTSMPAENSKWATEQFNEFIEENNILRDDIIKIDTQYNTNDFDVFSIVLFYEKKLDKQV